jgi:hypothetical protein
LENKAVHAIFPGECAVLAATKVEKIEGAEWKDQGMRETLWANKVNEFGPLIISIDTKGNNLIKQIKARFNERSRSSTRSTSRLVSSNKASRWRVRGSLRHRCRCVSAAALLLRQPPRILLEHFPQCDQRAAGSRLKAAGPSIHGHRLNRPEADSRGCKLLTSVWQHASPMLSCNVRCAQARNDL